MRIPFREAPPIPPKNVRGTLMTRAQGQLTTRNIKALYNQVAKLPPKSVGITARARAAKTTMGV